MKFFHTLRESIRFNLSRKEQRKGIGIIVLMVLNAVLDFFTVAAFLPLMAWVIQPDVSANRVIKYLYSSFGFDSPASYLIAISIAIALFIVVKNQLSIWIAGIKARYAFNLRSDLSARALRHYLENNFLEFTSTDFSRTLNTITSHPLAFANNIIISITTIISEALVILFILAFITYYDYKVLLMIASILIPIFVIFMIRKKTLKKISNDVKTTYPLVLKLANQAIEGFVEIKAYKKTAYFYQRFETVSKRLSHTFIKDQILQAGTRRLTEIILALVIGALVIYGVVADLSYHQTLMLLGIYAGASFRLMPSVNRILHAMQQLRTNEYVLQELRIPQRDHKSDVEAGARQVRFNKSIAYEEISFHYPGRPRSLERVSLTIQKGDKVAIRGSSGEGKTTLLLLMLGLLRPTSGVVLLDGQPVDNRNTWQELAGYVPQNPYILDGTVAENIAFGIPPEDIDRHKVLRIINDLHLNDLLQHLPNGIDSRVGERGVQLSGGQRQRIATARALYADTDILLLDEVTNQVEGDLETKILKLLDVLAAEKKTIIMVMHKIENPEFFDMIFKLENGSLQREK